MAKNEIYRVEIPIIVDDQTEAPLRQAERRISRFEKSARKTNDRIRQIFARDIDVRLKAIDRTWAVVRSVQSRLRGLTSRAWSVIVDVKDRVTGTIKGIIGKAGRLLSHPLALIGIGGGIAGATGAGLKAVMEEQDIVSSFEVMLGDRRAAEQRMQELIAFAGQTPFTRQEIWRSSRQLELLTGGALSTGTGLQMVGDIAAGTIQPFEEVAMWVGRLYDGLQSGRPIGQAAMRLQEMGALSGESRAKLEQLAESGMHISEIWPLVAEEFGRFGGLMEMQSKNLRNIVLGTKTFFTENVIKRWGQGIADALQPALWRFREWRGENAETIERMGEAIQRFGRRVGGTLVGYFERAIERISAIMSDPRFKHATFAEKVQMLVGAAMDDVVSWLKGPGKDKMVEAFKVIGEAAAKAYIGAMKTLGKTAIGELRQGNIMTAAVPAAAMWMMGGGAMARGAWSLGKGVWGAGKWAAKMLGGPATAQAATQAAGAGGTAAAARAAGAGGMMAAGGRILPALGRAQAWLGHVAIPAAIGLETVNVIRAEEGERRRVAVRGAGRIAGMAAGGKAGAAAGGAVGAAFGGVGAAPGAAIGGILGGIGGWFGGQVFADKVNEWLDKIDFEALKMKALAVWESISAWASDTWESISSWVSDTWGDIVQSASDTWAWITENITLEKLAEGAGFLLGYLESTIFSGEWWQGHWESVKDWASEKWASMVEVWDNAKEVLGDTLFSGEWWLERWEAVKGWAAEKWASFIEIWEDAKEALSETIFSGEWWLEHWESVKSWTDEKWATFISVWEDAKTAIKNTLFSEKWWSGQWEAVKGWADNALSSIASKWEGIKESFRAGREAGRQAGAVRHAAGGILTRPHLGLVAEAGPEAIIPLSARMRGRAMALWEETGRHLGVRPYAAGGIAGLTGPAGAPVAVPAVAGAGVGSSSVNVTNYIDVSVSGDDADPDKIAGAIAAKIESVFHNMTK